MVLNDIDVVTAILCMSEHWYVKIKRYSIHGGDGGDGGDDDDNNDNSFLYFDKTIQEWGQ